MGIYENNAIAKALLLRETWICPKAVQKDIKRDGTKMISIRVLNDVLNN